MRIVSWGYIIFSNSAVVPATSLCDLCASLTHSQALEYQAGFPANSSGGEVAISQEQWEEFLNAFRDRLKLLRLIANVSEWEGGDIRGQYHDDPTSSSSVCLYV